MKSNRSLFARLFAFVAVAALWAVPLLGADFSVTAANVLASATADVAEGVAGAAILAGQVVYVDASDSGKVKLADNNVSAVLAAVRGIAITSAPGAGQPVKYCRKDASFAPGFTVASGQPVFLSSSAGGLCPFADLATGSYGVFIGVGIGSNKIALLPVVGGLIP